MTLDLDSLFVSLQSGNKRTGGIVMSLLEDEGPQSKDMLRRLYKCQNKAFTVGITGWPGVGKSSLISRLAEAFLDSGKKVGVIAVDPTSPFSGGSLLGDRIRFREVEGSDGLYIRSVASRGHRGGLSRSARAFIKVMEVMGYDIVLVETVGVGQDQTDIALIADTTVVVVAPGLGDYLQAIKSGILEVGDIFVVNKADRRDSDRTALDLQNAVMMREKEAWRPPVVKTVATESGGVNELMAELARHAAHCATEGSVRAPKARAAQKDIVEAIKTRLLHRFFSREELEGVLMAQYAGLLCQRMTDPSLLADAILEERGIS